MTKFKNYPAEQPLNICWGQNKTSNTALPLTAGKFNELITSSSVQSVISQLAESPHNDQLKARLPYFCFCASRFDNNQRSNDNAHPNGMGMIDIDSMTETPEAFYERMGGDYQMRLNGVVLFHKSPSGDGVHLVFRLQPGEDIALGQQRLCRNMGIDIEIDKQVKNVGGISFAVTSEYIFYLNEEAFLSTEAAVPATTAPIVPATVSTALVPTSQAESPLVEDAEIIDEILDSDLANAYEGVPLKLIEEHVMTDLLKAAKLPSEADHNRHDYYVRKAAYMCHVCDRDPDLLFALLDGWGLPDNERIDICRYTCQNSATKAMPQTLRKLIEQLKATLTPQHSDDDKELIPYVDHMPTNLPPLLNLISKIVPEYLREHAVIATLPWLGTLLTSLRYSYDRVHTELPTLMVYVVGVTGSGKGFTSILHEMLYAPIQERDKESEEILQEWADDVAASGNGRRAHAPKVIKRFVESNFTSAGLNKQMMASKGQHLFLYTEESDEIRISKEITAQFRKSFDNGRSGQTRAMAQSVSGSTKMRLNMVLCGTDRAMHRLIPDAESGLAGRFIYINMPKSKKRPIWNPLTVKQQQKVKNEVERLYNIGLTEVAIRMEKQDPETRKFSHEEIMQDGHEEVWIKGLPRLENRIEEWIDQRQTEFDNTQNDTLEIFTHRIPTIMRRVGMILYALEGMQETTRSIEFAIWVGNYALQTFLNNYGQNFDQIMGESTSYTSVYRRTAHNLDILEELSDTFSYDDVERLRIAHGLKVNKSVIRTAICRWRKDNKIYDDPKFANLYHKVKAAI